MSAEVSSDRAFPQKRRLDLSGRHNYGPVLGKPGNDRRIEVQRFGNHIDRTVRQPIRQLHLRKPIRPEYFHVNELRVAGAPPPARGWTLVGAGANGATQGSPARAGMDPDGGAATAG